MSIRSTLTWSTASLPMSSGRMVWLTLRTALRTPFPPYRDASPSRSSTASWAPVDAPDGTMADPTAPPSRNTSTSTVGFPRESSTSRAATSSISVDMALLVALVKGLDAGERLALDKLERGAAAGRDVAHPAGEAQPIDGRHAVAAA